MQPGFGQELLAKSLLTQLLILLRRAMDAQPQAVESLASDEKIAAIMQYLSQHPTESVSIDDLAARFYISKYHMMRRFRAETGYTVHAYLTGKRLALAREQIAAGTPGSPSPPRRPFCRRPAPAASEITPHSAAPTAASSASRPAAQSRMPPKRRNREKRLDSGATICYDSKAEFVRVPAGVAQRPGHQPSKLGTRVRFPSPAPLCASSSAG